MNIIKNRMLTAAFTLSGSIIGAGILGLPYVFAQSGYAIGLFWIIFLGLVVGYTFLCLGEVCLRTKETHQLPGYAEKYLGKFGKIIMLLSVIFGSYAALLAYLVGESQSISIIITNSDNAMLYSALGFWLFMSFLLKEGMRNLKKIETIGVLIVIFLITFIYIIYSPEIKYQNLNDISWNYFFIPFGVVLFALLGFNAIPEIKILLKNKEKVMKKVILIGISIPIILYIIFSLIFVGVFGNNVSQIATLSSGKLITLLGIFTMMTSYFILSFSLKDVFTYDLHFPKKTSYTLVSVIPLALYLGLFFLDKINFTQIIGIGGVISGGLTGILIMMMNLSAKKNGNRKPEYSMQVPWYLFTLLTIVYLFGVVIQIFF